jgi:hypothetical protein
MKWLRLVLPMGFAIACGSIGQPDPESLAQTMVAQTAAAATATASPTRSPTPTDTPVPPTATPSSTPTVSPTPGPFTFVDDFSRRSRDWDTCEECNWQDGVLLMGPYPVSGAYVQHVALCGPCGLVRYYHMGVDVAYGDGPSERGFGLLVSITDEYMMTFEITPWQTAILWSLDFDGSQWEFVNGFYTGRVRAGRASNRIEVITEEGTSTGKVNIQLLVNGRVIFVAYNQPGDPGAVGLTLYGHAMSASFDDFSFEELEPYSRTPAPDGVRDPSG